jgi:hypothetical protein
MQLPAVNRIRVAVLVIVDGWMDGWISASVPVAINQSINIDYIQFLPIALMTSRNQLIMPINVFSRRFHFFVLLCVSLLYAYVLLSSSPNNN